MLQVFVLGKSDPVAELNPLHATEKFALLSKGLLLALRSLRMGRL